MRKTDDDASGAAAVTFDASDFPRVERMAGMRVTRIIASGGDGSVAKLVTITNNETAGPTTVVTMNFSTEPFHFKDSPGFFIPFVAAGSNHADTVTVAVAGGGSEDVTILVEADPVGG